MNLVIALAHALTAIWRPDGLVSDRKLKDNVAPVGSDTTAVLR